MPLHSLGPAPQCCKTPVPWAVVSVLLRALCGCTGGVQGRRVEMQALGLQQNGISPEFLKERCQGKAGFAGFLFLFFCETDKPPEMLRCCK